MSEHADLRADPRDVRTDFGLDVQPIDEGCLVAVTGDLDLHTAPELRDVLGSLVDGGRARLVVDLSEVAFIDSMGLGVLVGATRRAHERGVDVRIVVSTPDVRRIFEITGLGELFDLRESRAAALVR